MMKSATAPEGRSRPKILIVDDDARNLLALKMVIDDLADVITAGSGEAALRHLLKSDFAVILLDVFMPIMDGYEVAAFIRQRPQSNRIPIIFLSAVNKEEAHLRRGYLMGAVDYVFKPVEPIVLRSKVAVFVDLYEKTREIQWKAQEEKKLRDENMRVQYEQLLTEQELRRTEARQEIVLNSLPIVLYLQAVDADPPVPHYFSGNLKGITGFDADDFARQPSLWIDRLHPDDRAGVLTSRANAGPADQTALEYRWLSAGGDYLHLLDHAVVLYGPNGRPSEIAGTLFDVTSQRLLEDKLSQAQKMDAVGKLTGGIAHDFNNLLAAVLGGMRLIERRCDLNDEGRRIIEMTRHAAEQGAELVKRLLAFSRRQQLSPAPVPIARLATSLMALLEHTLGGLVEVQWDVEPEIWPALADENQLELAVMNLIINARDAMPDGGTVTISAANRSWDGQNALAAGDYVVISVRDMGTGIAPQLLPTIFEPFVTTKEVGKGTGLGLSMVYGFARQSGGKVEVHSKPGQGAVFEIWLPRAGVVAKADAIENVRIGFQGTEGVGRILLVDDHDAVRTVMTQFLVDLGHQAVAADSAASALETLLSDGPFDLLVTDYAMPRGSGTELIKMARQFYPHLPAIIMTGYVDSNMIANRPSDTVVLTKPIAFDVFRAAVQTAITVEDVDIRLQQTGAL